MTNAEYEEFAKKLLKNTQPNDDAPENPNTDITNIGEIFALRIIEGIAKLDENTFPYHGADKVNNEFISLINNKISNDNSRKDIGNLPISDTTIIFANYSLFFGIRLAINTHSNPEYMLQRLGVEDARSLISKVNNVENIDNTEESFYLILEIHDYLYSFINDDELSRLSLWGIISFYGSSFIKACKSESLENVFYFFKDMKYTVEKYYSIYKERMIIIQNTAKSLFNEEYNVEDILPQDIIDFFINNSTKFKSFKDWGDSVFEEFGDKYGFMILDLFFILYYFIYEAPQHIVKLGFYLMSDMLSSNINRAITPSFQKQDYAGLIQYEYEWWCKETGERLSLPFPFFEGQLNLSEISIVDYDLDKKKAPLQIIVKDDNLPQEETSSLPTPQEENILSHADKILFPFYTIFETKSVSERGNTFRKIYLPALAEYSTTINDSYTLYGFAYLLYKSKYLDFKETKFDKGIIETVASAFFIDDRFTIKPYVESKARLKAWQILNSGSNTIPMALLSEKELKKICPV